MDEYADSDDDRPVVRLSWLLRAYPGSGSGPSRNYETLYWQSPEAAMFISKADALGLTMSVCNTGTLLLLPLLRRPGTPRLGMESNTQAATACMLLLAVLQLLLLRKQLGVYLRYRHCITCTIRALRCAVFFLPAINRSYDVITKWGAPGQHGTAAALAAYMFSPSLMHLQASCAYPLPTSAGVLLQPLGAATALSWVWSSPTSMHKLPGMHAAAQTVCSSFRGVYELLLYIIIDIGVMPGVPAAGVDAFGLPDRCESGAVYAQLLVYGTLMMSLFVPLFVSYVIELHHKLSFWQDRGVAVEADRSVLLPLPDSPVLSHFLVCFAAPLVLWFVAEGLAPYLTPVNLDGLQ